MAISVGLSEFTIRTGRYAERFPVVEVQQTFCEPPTDSVIRGWRKRMPAGFEFSLGAWQPVTRTGGSPACRRLKRELTPDERAPSARSGHAHRRRGLARHGPHAVRAQWPRPAPASTPRDAP